VQLGLDLRWTPDLSGATAHALAAADALAQSRQASLGDVQVAPRDVLAAVLPNPAQLGHLMHGKTCAGTWVKGTYDGQPREVYLYHVADNDTTMRDYGSQAVLWQTAVNPVVALELLASGDWAGAGVLGPEAFPSEPFLDLVAEMGAPTVCEERTPSPG
jgi:saccharopine dehydrogenase-like NADP-dependent oxidoreductase